MKRRKAKAELASFTFFDHLNNITFQKKRWEDLTNLDHKSWSLYMGLRYLSMDYTSIELISSIQYLLHKMPANAAYNCLISILPKRKQFLKYIGSKKGIVEISTASAETLDIIKQHHSCSKDEAIQLFRVYQASPETSQYLENLLHAHGCSNEIKIFSRKKGSKKVKKRY